MNNNKFNQAFFVTGTDTEIGKTFVSTALISTITQLNYRVAGYKPVASDAIFNPHNQRLENSDALLLQKHSNVSLNYDEVNPYCFKQATSPHIASQLAGKNIEKSIIYNSLINLGKKSDIVIIEGAGGWFTPLTNNWLYADWVQEYQLPVILVVGMKLGCINHALLTQQALLQANIPFVGWVANCCQPQGQYYPQYLTTLQQWLTAPLLAELPYSPNNDPQKLTGHFNLSILDTLLFNRSLV